MKKIVFITPRDAVFGFSLAGVVHVTVETEELEGVLSDTMAEPDTGLIILEERLLKNVSEEQMREIEGRWSGVLIVLPSPAKYLAAGEDYATQLIRKAIGYHVRLKV